MNSFQQLIVNLKNANVVYLNGFPTTAFDIDFDMDNDPFGEETAIFNGYFYQDGESVDWHLDATELKRGYFDSANQAWCAKDSRGRSWTIRPAKEEEYKIEAEFEEVVF